MRLGRKPKLGEREMRWLEEAWADRTITTKRICSTLMISEFTLRTYRRLLGLAPRPKNNSPRLYFTPAEFGERMARLRAKRLEREREREAQQVLALTEALRAPHTRHQNRAYNDAQAQAQLERCERMLADQAEREPVAVERPVCMVCGGASQTWDGHPQCRGRRSAA
jgi:hypothetical protein